jgi:general secretion pathway protein D
MIGDRTPVISSAAVPGSAAAGTSNAIFNTNIQYLETGIKLEVEPTIYTDGNVAIRLNLEVSKLGDQVTTNSGTVAFKTTTNNASTVLRLKDGETQVMGGLIQASDSMNQNNKLPGLGDIPFLGRLFGVQSDQWGNRELVLAITPHIIRNNQITEADLLELWSGTESSVKYIAPDLKVAASSGVVNQGAAAGAPAASRLPPPAPRAAPTMAAAPTLSVNVSGPAQAKIGDKINVALNAQGGIPINSLSLTLAYDSDALKPITVSEGDLLRRAGVKGNFEGKIDAASGTLSADLATESGSSANAAGSIASLQFEVIGGQGPVLISASGISATDASGAAIPVANPPALSIAIQP